jgi:hypothetical protein
MGLAGEVPFDIHSMHDDAGEHIIVGINENGFIMQPQVGLGRDKSGKEQKEEEAKVHGP